MDLSSAKAQVAPDLLNALLILSDTTVRRSAVDRKDLEPYWKSERRLKGWYFLAVDLSITFLNTGTLAKLSNNLENKTPSDTYWRVQLVCKKIQAQFFRTTVVQ